MADQGFITPEVAAQAKAGLDLERGQAYKRKREEYFFEYVRQVLIDRYGEKRVQNGGFKVYTTIDPALQSVARRTIAENLYYDDDPDGAVVMIDSQKGFIRAMASTSASTRRTSSTWRRRPAPAGLGLQDVRADRGRRQQEPYSTLYESKRLSFTDDHYGPIDVKTYSDSYRGRSHRAGHSARTTRSSSS